MEKEYDEYDLDQLISWASANGEMKKRRAFIEFKALRARNAELEAEIALIKEDNEILQCEVGELKSEVARLRKAMADIREWCSFQEDEVQKAVRDRITRRKHDAWDKLKAAIYVAKVKP